MAVRPAAAHPIAKSTCMTVDPPTATFVMVDSTDCSDLIRGTDTWALATLNELGMELVIFTSPFVCVCVLLASAEVHLATGYAHTTNSGHDELQNWACDKIQASHRNSASF